MTNTTDHLDIERSRRLKELGAWVSRELRQGDWVLLDSEYHDMVLVGGPQSVVLAGDDNGHEIDAGRCIFLPHLGDLLGALEKACSLDGVSPRSVDIGYTIVVEDGRHTGTDPWCGIYDAHVDVELLGRNSDAYMFGEGPTILEAAADCLISLLERRTTR